ncbi:MAG: outer membrane beta-barrel domain-containing protein [Bacteriovoracaceae bacterium]|nr:outer membrane beta-barrel domain-containing protein [Bacteriovoracaceae bacterium]
MLKLMLVGVLSLYAVALKAGEESTYDFLWLDPDKAVYVLQNKIHKKENSLYVDVGYLKNLTSTFQDTSGVAVKAGYYFHEEWAIEGLYLGYQNSNNDNFNNVRLLNSGFPFVRRPVSTMGLGVVWSPFYGKINTFNTIVYFDWSFGAGIAQVTTESNLTSVQNTSAPNYYDKEHNTGAYAKSAVKFHLNANWHVGVEWIGTYYNAAGPKNPKQKNFRQSNDLIFQVGWSY